VPSTRGRAQAITLPWSHNGTTRSQRRSAFLDVVVGHQVWFFFSRFSRAKFLDDVVNPRGEPGESSPAGVSRRINDLLDRLTRAMARASRLLSGHRKLFVKRVALYLSRPETLEQLFGLLRPALVETGEEPRASITRSLSVREWMESGRAQSILEGSGIPVAGSQAASGNPAANLDRADLPEISRSLVFPGAVSACPLSIPKNLAYVFQLKLSPRTASTSPVNA